MGAASQSEADLLAELNRYKTLYEQEKEQHEEFQHYSKELEAEMDMELAIYKKKATELETQNRRLQLELMEAKKRFEKERSDFLANENLLKTKLSSSEESCRDLKQKLRKVEQTNDDLERRERIQSQELADWAVRYEKCLERCAYLEAGMYSGEENSMDTTAIENPSGASSEMEETKISSSTTVNSFSSDVTSSITQSSLADHARINGESRQRTSSMAIREDGFISPPASRMKLSNDCSDSQTSVISGYTRNSPSGGLYTLGKESRRSSEIVSSLFRKIEEVERQISPKKYVIHRPPNRSK